MKKIVRFDERSDLINYVESGIIEDEHIGRTIYKRAKYNYFIKNLSDAKNYNDIVKFIEQNSNSGLTDLDLYEFIKTTIRNAKKYGLKYVEKINITKSELDFISNLQDIKLEKVAFVLLCLAKYHNEVSEEPDDRVYSKLNEIKNMARINMNKVDFEYFYANLYDKHVLLENNSPTSTVQIVGFISHDENDEVVFEVLEEDYLELAYLYLNWKDGCKGFARCCKCNRLIKQSKTKPRKYCEECAKEVEKENSKERVRRYREKCNENLTQQND